MNRRELLKSGAACAAFSMLPNFASAASTAFAPQPSDWRSFEITTSVTPAASGEVIRVWVPLAGFNADDWNRPEGNRWTTNAKVARLDRDPASGTGLLYLEWDGGEEKPQAEIISLISTRDRSGNLEAPAKVVPLTRAERERYLAGTRLAPVDGIVKQTSDRIVADADTDQEKARRIYDWVVANTYRRGPPPRGGGGQIIHARLR